LLPERSHRYQHAAAGTPSDDRFGPQNPAAFVNRAQPFIERNLKKQPILRDYVIDHGIGMIGHGLCTADVAWCPVSSTIADLRLKLFAWVAGSSDAF